MKRPRRWAVIGLLCVSGAIVGCVQLPSRGLFVRRTQPAITDETRADQPDDSQFFVRDKKERDRQADAAAANPDSVASEASATGGLFGVSSRSASEGDSAAVEAPSPKRRSAAAPAALNVPSDARELRPDASPTRNDIVTAAASELLDPRGSGVVTADYDSAASRTNSSDIELAAAKRRESQTVSEPNPWDRFRDLTTGSDSTTDRGQLRDTRPRTDANPIANEPIRWPSATNPQSAILPQPSRETFPQRAAGVTETNTTSTPELWPRAPGASGFNSAAPAPYSPPNVQWVNAEQPGSNAGTIPGFNLAPTTNMPPNFGPPPGAPVAIAPLVNSSELDRLITQTTVEAAAMTPGDNDITRQLYLRKQVQLRLLLLIAGQMDRALQPVPGIDPADQEFWQQMLWGMANYFDTQGMPDASERASQTIVQLKSAAARLQEKARLELHNVAFCHKISGFGNSQRFKRDEFTPGQPVLLYAEVANFKSELVPDGQFRTLMKSTLEVIEAGPTGRLVETLPLPPSEDRCRNQRRDYYHSYEFAIPQACNPGPHMLRLRVEDQLGKKIAVTALNFTVQ